MSATTSGTGLSVQRDGDVLQLTLDREESGNRLSRPLLEALAAQLEAVSGADAPKVVVLAGAGPDFSLGREPAPGPATPSGLRREFGLIQRVNELVVGCPAVTVAVIRGRALGAGLSLAARCDLVVAADDARLAFPEVPHGIPPTIVLSHYRYVLLRRHLLDLILTGREITAEEGQRMGLVSRVCPPAEVDAAVKDLVQRLGGYDVRTVRVVKQFVRRLDDVGPREAPTVGIEAYVNEMVDRAMAGGTR
ncbi:enoyl-CoA hydratase/isomerase family protein [Micromonospora sp. NPDC048830]|uniref:enoyl-CoA hydratase/isomerase family protein n=1 Tax=Micromonospora sp. NPDC048830 TaxID=3364257 RepID=UPI003718A393